MLEEYDGKCWGWGIGRRESSVCIYRKNAVQWRVPKSNYESAAYTTAGSSFTVVGVFFMLLHDLNLSIFSLSWYIPSFITP